MSAVIPSRVLCKEKVKSSWLHARDEKLMSLLLRPRLLIYLGGNRRDAKNVAEACRAIGASGVALSGDFENKSPLMTGSRKECRDQEAKS